MECHLDHPILTESLRRIRSRLGATGLGGLRQQVLERVVHSGGDLTLANGLRFSPGACERGLLHLRARGVILTDTAMAREAVAPMAARTCSNPVHSMLRWAPAIAPPGGTRAAAGLERALEAHPEALVLIGSAPTALERLVALAANGACRPALVIGMPVGFVGVLESKKRLTLSNLHQIRLEGHRGGAALAAAAVNALLRAALLSEHGERSAVSR